uniref:Apolipoprotein C-II n=1 Tax=Echeneis naucrates TaxID=173247 RepID=A0A665SVL8_ECHNA
KVSLFSFLTDWSDTMNKLLVVTVLVSLFALSAESFRLPRQTEEEQGTISAITDKIRNLYGNTVNTANEYLGKLKGMKLEEKVKNFYYETSTVVGTYAGILQDQFYHFIYPQQ